MNLLKKIFIFLLLILLSFSLFSKTDKILDKKNDKNTDWLNNYINIDPTDDLYHGFLLKNYKISKNYVKNLIWHQDIDFFIDAVDEHNLRQNINILPRFPYVFMPYGGYSYNRAIDLGFLFRADNIANSRIAFTTAISYGQKGRLWMHANVEYPALLKNRLKLLGTISFFTSFPQYSSEVATYYESNFLMKLFNRAWNLLKIDFNRHSETGFHFVSGIDYRIPFIETNTITTFELTYKYDDVKIDSSSPPDQISLKQSNFGFNIKEELRWNKFKQTATIPVGNYLSVYGKFYIPTTIGLPNNEFRFKSRIEEKFNYKIWREFAFKLRLMLAANYNISEDFSGDPYIRGFADYELTGWFALLGNLELYIPLVDVKMKSAFAKSFAKDAKFVLYWTLFADGGFTIENYDYYLDNFIERLARDKIKNSLIKGNLNGQTHLGKGHYILPAISVGSGIQIYPFFLHFILRFDVSVNLLKAVIYEQPEECVEFVISFSSMF